MARKPPKSYTGLPDKVRKLSGTAVVKATHALEALVHQAKTAQYNTKGNPEAAGVVLLATKVTDLMHRLGDALVARALVLDVQVNYNLAFVTKNSGLKPFPLDLEDPAQAVEILSDAWMAVCEIVREQIAAMREAGDMVSAHITEHVSMELEANTSMLQDILAGDPMEALESIGTEAHPEG